MTAVAGDSITASIVVNVPADRAFALFTGEIDRWWLRGPRFRQSGVHRGLIHVEARVGGRVFESWNDRKTERAFEVGRIIEWNPPLRFAFSWRNSVFAEGEQTLVEVDFRDGGDRTIVTVTHRGWAEIRADHPARHGQATAAFLRSLGLWWGDQLGSLRRVAKDAAEAGLLPR